MYPPAGKNTTTGAPAATVASGANTFNVRQSSEVVFVDDKVANVEAARAEGWVGVVYKADADGQAPGTLDLALQAAGLPVENT